jgi:hypothetical protein
VRDPKKVDCTGLDFFIEKLFSRFEVVFSRYTSAIPALSINHYLTHTSNSATIMTSLQHIVKEMNVAGVTWKVLNETVPQGWNQSDCVMVLKSLRKLCRTLRMYDSASRVTAGDIYSNFPAYLEGEKSRQLSMMVKIEPICIVSDPSTSPADVMPLLERCDSEARAPLEKQHEKIDSLCRARKRPRVEGTALSVREDLDRLAWVKLNRGLSAACLEFNRSLMTIMSTCNRIQ